MTPAGGGCCSGLWSKEPNSTGSSPCAAWCVRSSSARPSSHGQVKPSRAACRPKAYYQRQIEAGKALHTPCAPSPTSGSASSTAAGRTGWSMTKRSISPPCANKAATSSPALRRCKPNQNLQGNQPKSPCCASSQKPSFHTQNPCEKIRSNPLIDHLSGKLSQGASGAGVSRPRPCCAVFGRPRPRRSRSGWRSSRIRSPD